jgi:hypothetical protein
MSGSPAVGRNFTVVRVREYILEIPRAPFIPRKGY